jgi:Ser/Thr protein kinase RdoA (MazF antagonist)
MTAPGTLEPRAPDDNYLRRVVETSLGERAGAPRKIVQFRRTPSEFSSSHAVEELDITLANDVCLTLVFKNLSKRALTMEARANKPRFLINPRREIDVYNTLLPRYGQGTANCVASVIDERREQYWLILEKVPGVELYQVGDFDTWLETARWLARFHDATSAFPAKADSVPSLLHHDRSYYRTWPRRAKSNLESEQAPGHEEMVWLGSRYERVIDRLVALPRTLLHGDFNASNILVRARQESAGIPDLGSSVRICPVDWEMAAVGTGFTDLAALISGGWTEEQSMALVSAYLDARPGRWNELKDRGEVLIDVKCCQLHLAIQWLGWSPGWSPPVEHRQNWMGQALDLARQLEL